MDPTTAPTAEIPVVEPPGAPVTPEVSPDAQPNPEPNGEDPTPEGEGGEGGEEGKKEPTPDEQRMGARFAALSKRERELVEKERNFKAQLDQAQQQQTKIQPILDAIAQAKTNPGALLEAAGISMDHLVRFYMNGGQPTPEDKIELLQQQIEEDRETRRKEREEAEAERVKQAQAQVDRQIDAYKREVVAHIAENPEDYELILAHEAQDEVFNLIIEHHSETGEILSPDVAAKKYEEDLVAAMEKVMGLKKFEGRVKPKEEAQPEETPEATSKRSAPTSLSSKQVMSDPVSKPNAPMTRDERLRAAAAKLQFTDKK